MKSTYLLEIVTPDKSFFEDEVEMTIVRTTEGDIGILKGHELVVAPVSVGSIRVKQNGVYRDAACSAGFLTVEETKSIIITDSAEWADEIDVERAKKAADRAARRIEEKHDEIDVLRAKVSLDRAINRIRVSSKSIDHTNL